MRPTALRSTPIFHPCAKPDVKLYQVKERERRREKKKRERDEFEREEDGKCHLLLYIYSNKIIPAVLTSGRGASFVVIIPRLYPRCDTIRLSPSSMICSLVSLSSPCSLFADRSRVVIEEASGWCVTLMISAGTFMAYRIYSRKLIDSRNMISELILI